MQELVRVYPEGCEHADSNGMLPLHRAAQYHPFEVVQLLLDTFPEGAQHPNKIGQLPLHFAAHGGAEVRACNHPNPITISRGVPPPCVGLRFRVSKLNEGPHVRGCSGHRSRLRALVRSAQSTLRRK